MNCLALWNCRLLLLYNLHGLYCSCGSFGGLCNFKQGCLKYARTKLLRHDCNCASPQTLSPNKRNQACTPTENTWKNLPPSQSPRNVTLQNCTTPKTEVLTRQYADCSMSSVSNFNPVCPKPISVTSCRKFHFPHSKNSRKLLGPEIQEANGAMAASHAPTVNDNACR